MSFCIELFCVVTLQYQILVRIAIAYFIIEKKKAAPQPWQAIAQRFCSIRIYRREYKIMSVGLKFRYAQRKDVSLILRFIKELAVYEKMLDEVIADEIMLEEWIFDRQKAEVIFAVVDGKEVGFALFFHNFSTFLGRAGLYLEDLFVLPEYRGKGYGKAILKKLAEIAVERKCGRLEWSCLDWNKPSIDFYLSLDAEPMSDWTVYRLTGDRLKKLAQ